MRTRTQKHVLPAEPSVDIRVVSTDLAQPVAGGIGRVVRVHDLRQPRISEQSRCNMYVSERTRLQALHEIEWLRHNVDHHVLLLVRARRLGTEHFECGSQAGSIEALLVEAELALRADSVCTRVAAVSSAVVKHTQRGGKGELTLALDPSRYLTYIFTALPRRLLQHILQAVLLPKALLNPGADRTIRPARLNVSACLCQGCDGGLRHGLSKGAAGRLRVRFNFV